MIKWENVGKVKKSRMQDMEYASELLFYLLNNDASDGNSKEVIDSEYKKWNKKLSDTLADEITKQFNEVLEYIDKLGIRYDEYKLKGVSHFYALFGFSKMMIDKEIAASKIKGKLDDFYKHLRQEDLSYSGVKDYQDSMQSNTLSKSQRLKRINALVKACS